MPSRPMGIEAAAGVAPGTRVCPGGGAGPQRPCPGGPAHLASRLVGEVLVIENGDRPFGFSDDARDLFEEIAARKHLLSQPGHGIVPMLPDQQNPVHRQPVASQRQRRPDAFMDGYVELVGQLASDVPLVNLVDVYRGDAGPRRNQAVVSRKSPQELVHDHAGVAVGEEGGGDGGDLRERFGALGRSRGCRPGGSGRRFLLAGAGAGGRQQQKHCSRCEQKAGKTTVSRNVGGQTEEGGRNWARRIPSVGVGIRCCRVLPAAEPKEPPAAARQAGSLQSADAAGLGRDFPIRSARGGAGPACRRWRWRCRWAGAPDPGRSWSSRCQGLVDSGEEVSDGDHSLGHVGPPLVTGSHYLASLDAAAAQRHRPAVGPVVPAPPRVDVGRAAELAHHQNDGGFQQAPLIQVFHQRRE